MICIDILFHGYGAVSLNHFRVLDTLWYTRAVEATVGNYNMFIKNVVQSVHYLLTNNIDYQLSVYQLMLS